MEFINFVFDIEKIVKKFYHIINIKSYEISELDHFKNEDMKKYLFSYKYD